MGIRDLKKIIDKFDVNSLWNISDIVEKTKLESGCEEASLAIDTNTCIGDWYWLNNKNGYCGGQWKEYQMVLKTIITDCKKLNLKLIFFLDGYDKKVESIQRNLWHIGQEDLLDDLKEIFSWFDKDEYCSDIDSTASTITHTVPHFTRYILACLGETVTCAYGDANYDIMKFAVETPECIGVLTNDTDFLAYPNSKPVFNARFFDPESNMALVWDKPSLLQKLGLEEEDMPAFACITGNNLTKGYSDELQKLKWKLGGEWAQSMASLLNSFKEKNGYKLKLLQDQILPDCQEFIFCDVVKSYILPKQKSPWLQCGIDTIETESLNSNQIQCSEGILIEANKRSSWIYILLKYRKVKALTSYEIGIFDPQFVLYQFIRDSLYSLILGEIDSENKTVEEWIGYNYKRVHGFCHPVPAIYKGKQVTVHQLWEPEYLRNDKIHIFEQCIGLSGHYESLDNISISLPEYLIVSSYLLCYMAQRMTNITESDLKCLIECAIWCKDVPIGFTKKLSSRVKPTSRGVEIASHYGRGLEMLLYANILCGDPFSRESFLPTNTLDGFLFQAIYQDPKKYYYEDTKNFRNILTGLCLHKIPSHNPIDYHQNITKDIETLDLRPQGKWNFHKEAKGV